MTQTDIRPRYRGLRRATNREALLGAAIALIGSRGLADVSVDEIVHRAGVAKGTFYNHFRDKDDIAHHVALQVRHEVRDRIAGFKDVTPDPACRLAVALTLFMGLALWEPQKARILVTMLTEVSDVSAPMNERVRATLKSGKATGRFSFASLDAAFVFVLGLVFAGVSAILERGAADGNVGLIRDLVAHGLLGLGVPTPEASRLADTAWDQVRECPGP